jgi:hypothetical protein
MRILLQTLQRDLPDERITQDDNVISVKKACAWLISELSELMAKDKPYFCM